MVDSLEAREFKIILRWAILGGKRFYADVKADFNWRERLICSLEGVGSIDAFLPFYKNVVPNSRED